MVRRLPIALVAALVLCVPASAHAAGASATVGVVDCDGGAVPVTISNDGAPLTFQILRDDAVISSRVVSGGAPIQVFVPIAEASHALVTVRYGSSYVSSSVARRCTGTGNVRSFSTASASSADAPFVSSATAAASSASAASPDTSSASARTAKAKSEQLPAGGLSPWWIASLAALAAMSLAAIGLVITRRRRAAADEPQLAPAGPPRG
jgi:hypothetical protein